jgi:glutathione S-transferase
MSELTLTIADAFYAPVVSRFRTYGVEIGGAAGDYMEALWAYPAMREWVSKASAETWVVERYER